MNEHDQGPENSKDPRSVANEAFGPDAVDVRGRELRPTGAPLPSHAARRPFDFDPDRRLVGAWMQIGTQLSERSIQHGVALALDLQRELTRRIFGVLDFVERNNRDSVALLRRLTIRASSFGEDVAEAFEHVAMHGAGRLERAREEVGEAASQVGARWVSARIDDAA